MDGDASRPFTVVTAQYVLDGPVPLFVQHDLSRGRAHERVCRLLLLGRRRRAGQWCERAAQGEVEIISKSAGGEVRRDLRSLCRGVHSYVKPLVNQRISLCVNSFAS